jgi:hypothetical protein
LDLALRDGVTRWRDLGFAVGFAVVIAAGCGRSPILAERWGADGDGGAGSADDRDEGDDAGHDDEGGDEVGVDCDKVDFLFVIDNSGSMFDHHTNLVKSIDVFSEGIDAAVARNTDLHVGIVTSDVYAGTHGDCHVLGGLVTETSGAHSSQMACGPFAEGNYMTEQDDLEASFACAAMVGTQGDDVERPMDAMLAAIDEDGGAAKCNAGFLRPDALLVVVVLTDEWDGPSDPEGAGSATGAQSWRRGLVEAKGSEDAVVFVALVNEEPRQCRPHHVINDGTPLVGFAESLPYGFVGSICGDYAETFGQALDVVAAACSGE